MQEIWERRSADVPVKTPEALVTLASIVEKETGRPDERSRVAAVFVNRLRQRMKLQSDPTIIYGLVGGKGTLGRPIMRSEIDQPTPYNTYVIEGLPPGPIANPGRASLEARPIRRAPRSCTSSPTAPARTRSPRTCSSISRTSPSCASSSSRCASSTARRRLARSAPMPIHPRAGGAGTPRAGPRRKSRPAKNDKQKAPSRNKAQ